MSTDSKYLGPGYWASWHIKSFSADTKKKKGEIARCIAMDIKNFPCLKCREHAKVYVKSNPLIDAVNDSNILSLFKWTVDFHNEVNFRLDKKIISLPEAVHMWNGENFCHVDCGDEEPQPEPQQEPQPEPQPEPDPDLDQEPEEESLLIKYF